MVFCKILKLSSIFFYFFEILASSRDFEIFGKIFVIIFVYVDQISEKKINLEQVDQN